MIELSDILYKYQREDSNLMVSDPLKMNGSEMGTGKTEVAIKTVMDCGAKKVLKALLLSLAQNVYEGSFRALF